MSQRSFNPFSFAAITIWAPLLIAGGIGLWLALAAPRAPQIKVSLADASEKVEVVQAPDGAYRFVLKTLSGSRQITPDDLARRVYEEQSSRSWWMTLLNVSSPIGLAWVGLGLFGQVLFTGRMIVQWLASEKSKRSVVPVAFWWMSLSGATMLMIYFLWRQDAVGVLGQATGWGIYVRNLHLIYRHHSPQQPHASEDPAPEPELAEE